MDLDDLIGQLLMYRSCNAGSGKLQVRLECDHGQTGMKPNWVGKAYISQGEESDYMVDTIHDDDLDGTEVPVLLIQGY